MGTRMRPSLTSIYVSAPAEKMTFGFLATWIGQDREIDESTMQKRVPNCLPPLGSTGRL